MQVTRSEGFSLVEVLVAAFIVALSIISVAAFIRKGNDMIALDKHRREAREIGRAHV
jgi:Tfp pilus assembly protein PilV